MRTICAIYAVSSASAFTTTPWCSAHYTQHTTAQQPRITIRALPLAATRCNALQYVAAHSRTWHHSVLSRQTRSLALSLACRPQVRQIRQKTPIYIKRDPQKRPTDSRANRISRPADAPQVPTALHFNALQHTATHCHALQRTATHCNALHRIHCNTLKHTNFSYLSPSLAVPRTHDHDSSHAHTHTHTP